MRGREILIVLLILSSSLAGTIEPAKKLELAGQLMNKAEKVVGMIWSAVITGESFIKQAELVAVYNKYYPSLIHYDEAPSNYVNLYFSTQYPSKDLDELKNNLEVSWDEIREAKKLVYKVNDYCGTNILTVSDCNQAIQDLMYNMKEGNKNAIATTTLALDIIKKDLEKLDWMGADQTKYNGVAREQYERTIREFNEMEKITSKFNGVYEALKEYLNFDMEGIAEIKLDFWEGLIQYTPIHFLIPIPEVSISKIPKEYHKQYNQLVGLREGEIKKLVSSDYELKKSIQNMKDYYLEWEKKTVIELTKTKDVYKELDEEEAEKLNKELMIRINKYDLGEKSPQEIMFETKENVIEIQNNYEKAVFIEKTKQENYLAESTILLQETYNKAIETKEKLVSLKNQLEEKEDYVKANSWTNENDWLKEVTDETIKDCENESLGECLKELSYLPTEKIISNPEPTIKELEKLLIKASEDIDVTQEQEEFNEIKRKLDNNLNEKSVKESILELMEIKKRIETKAEEKYWDLYEKRDSLLGMGVIIEEYEQYFPLIKGIGKLSEMETEYNKKLGEIEPTKYLEINTAYDLNEVNCNEKINTTKNVFVSNPTSINFEGVQYETMQVNAPAYSTQEIQLQEEFIPVTCKKTKEEIVSASDEYSQKESVIELTAITSIPTLKIDLGEVKEAYSTIGTVNGNELTINNLEEGEKEVKVVSVEGTKIQKIVGKATTKVSGEYLVSYLPVEVIGPALKDVTIKLELSEFEDVKSDKGKLFVTGEKTIRIEELEVPTNLVVEYSVYNYDKASEKILTEIKNKISLLPKPKEFLTQIIELEEEFEKISNKPAEEIISEGPNLINKISSMQEKISAFFEEEYEIEKLEREIKKLRESTGEPFIERPEDPSRLKEFLENRKKELEEKQKEIEVSLKEGKKYLEDQYQQVKETNNKISAYTDKKNEEFEGITNLWDEAQTNFDEQNFVEYKKNIEELNKQIPVISSSLKEKESSVLSGVSFENLEKELEKLKKATELTEGNVLNEEYSSEKELKVFENQVNLLKTTNYSFEEINKMQENINELTKRISDKTKELSAIALSVMKKVKEEGYYNKFFEKAAEEYEKGFYSNAIAYALKTRENNATGLITFENGSIVLGIITIIFGYLFHKKKKKKPEKKLRVIRSIT